MITVRAAELLINLITFLFAYMGTVTVAGAFRAWVARKMGDDTAQELGLLTLNPIVHIDLIGIFFLLIFYFGWGRNVPVNPFNIQGPYRWVKIATAYLSDSFAYFGSALIGMILLIVFSGLRMFVVAQSMLIFMQRMSHLYLINSCPTVSSLTIVLSFIIIVFIYLNVILCVLSLILNAFSIGMYFVMERSTKYATYNYYIIMLIPILFILLFSEPLRVFAIHLISTVGYSMSHMLGIV